MTEVKTQLNTEIAKKYRFLAAAILLFIGKIIINLIAGLPESFGSSLSKCNIKNYLILT